MRGGHERRAHAPMPLAILHLRGARASVDNLPWAESAIICYSKREEGHPFDERAEFRQQGTARDLGCSDPAVALRPHLDGEGQLFISRSKSVLGLLMDL